MHASRSHDPHTTHNLDWKRCVVTVAHPAHLSEISTFTHTVDFSLDIYSVLFTSKAAFPCLSNGFGGLQSST